MTGTWIPPFRIQNENKTKHISVSLSIINEGEKNLGPFKVQHFQMLFQRSHHADDPVKMEKLQTEKIHILLVNLRVLFEDDPLFLSCLD